MILDISLFLDIISETWLNAWILKQETWLIYLRRILRELVTRQLDWNGHFNGAMESRGLFYVAYRFQMYVVW